MLTEPEELFLFKTFKHCRLIWMEWKVSGFWGWRQVLRPLQRYDDLWTERTWAVWHWIFVQNQFFLLKIEILSLRLMPLKPFRVLCDLLTSEIFDLTNSKTKKSRLASKQTINNQLFHSKKICFRIWIVFFAFRWNCHNFIVLTYLEFIELFSTSAWRCHPTNDVNSFQFIPCYLNRSTDPICAKQEENETFFKANENCFNCSKNARLVIWKLCNASYSFGLCNLRHRRWCWCVNDSTWEKIASMHFRSCANFLIFLFRMRIWNYFCRALKRAEVKGADKRGKEELGKLKQSDL